MLADCQSALMAVFVVDEAPLLPRSSLATTAQQQKGKASRLSSALTVVDDPVTRAPAKGSKTDSMLTSRPIAQALTGKRVINTTTCKQRTSCRPLHATCAGCQQTCLQRPSKGPIFGHCVHSRFTCKPQRGLA